MAQLKLTPDLLAAALIGFEVQKFAVEGKIAEIRLLLNGGGSELAPPLGEMDKPRKKRTAAARRNMALAQKARWAKSKEGSAPQPASPAKAKATGTISPDGQKRIAAAQKKRRAAVKPATVKKATKEAGRPKAVNQTLEMAG